MSRRSDLDDLDQEILESAAKWCEDLRESKGQWSFDSPFIHPHMPAEVQAHFREVKAFISKHEGQQ